MTTLKVVCAWCGVTMQEGDVDAPVSHGICKECAKALYKEIAELELAQDEEEETNADH